MGIQLPAHPARLLAPCTAQSSLPKLARPADPRCLLGLDCGLHITNGPCTEAFSEIPASQPSMAERAGGPE